MLGDLDGTTAEPATVALIEQVLGDHGFQGRAVRAMDVRRQVA